MGRKDNLKGGRKIVKMKTIKTGVEFSRVLHDHRIAQKAFIRLQHLLDVTGSGR